MKAPLLESERLTYKPLSLQHLSSEYVNWLNDPETNKFIINARDYTIDKLKVFLLDVEAREMLFWGIHLKSNGKHIGNIKIDPVSQKHGLCEYGIFIGDKNEWSKGYAKEASQRVIKYCFEELNLRKMTLGFEIEGVYKKHELHEGRYLDTLRMALFNSNHKNR